MNNISQHLNIYTIDFGCSQIRLSCHKAILIPVATDKLVVFNTLSTRGPVLLQKCVHEPRYTKL